MPQRLANTLVEYMRLASGWTQGPGQTRGPRSSRHMNRRDALKTLVVVLGGSPVRAAQARVSTLVGTGVAGYSEQQINNPYGLVIGPDRALYFCDLDNQRIRRLDLKTRHLSTIAGNGQKAFGGDGGPATDASLNMPHEIQFDSAGHLYIAER